MRAIWKAPTATSAAAVACSGRLVFMLQEGTGARHSQIRQGQPPWTTPQAAVERLRRIVSARENRDLFIGRSNPGQSASVYVLSLMPGRAPIRLRAVLDHRCVLPACSRSAFGAFLSWPAPTVTAIFPATPPAST